MNTHSLLAQRVEAIFQKEGIPFTLGGEPTFVPVKPQGAEWLYTAVGETKLGYARRMGEFLVKSILPGAFTILTPGKLYPGEVNSRWALRMIANRDGSTLWKAGQARRRAMAPDVGKFCEALGNGLNLNDHWISFIDPKRQGAPIYALPLDYKRGVWKSVRWPLEEEDRQLVGAPGFAGLRLPLFKLPPKISRRALTVEILNGELSIFLPPLPQKPFLRLIGFLQSIVDQFVTYPVCFGGYIPEDKGSLWTGATLAADPGVLEINIPPCANWETYGDWIRASTLAARRAGLRPWKNPYRDHPLGTGGGNHLVWGGPSLDANPFFSRPRWIASILRYFQAHPALSYLFIGTYIGPSSQAPRPDESAREIADLELAYRYLETLPEGKDQRVLIGDALRHLLVDVSGNAHRTEISFDKFWNPGWPSGCQGLIEFRAIESVPHPEWTNTIALLWMLIAARTLKKPFKEPLKNFGRGLHDRFFLPSMLWQDLIQVLADLKSHFGQELNQQLLFDCWNWKFPLLLDAAKFGLEIRQGP